jgi:hypothetical protein
MLAYLSVRQEENDNDRRGQVSSRARSAEAELQSAEAAAWGSTRKEVQRG